MSAARVYPNDDVTVDVGRVTVAPIGKWSRGGWSVTGEPADLIRLSDALRQAALRAIDAKVAAAREVAS